MEPLLPNARVSWPMVTEGARWGTPKCVEVGVSSLMSAVTLSHRLRRLTYFRMGKCCFACGVLPITCCCCFFNFRELATFTKTNREMRICRTKYYIVTHICEPLVDDSFISVDIISSVINAQFLTLIPSQFIEI